MSSASRLRVAVLGEGEQAEQWSSAVAGSADVCRRPEQLERVDALVLAPGARELYARALQALEAGVAVLHAAPFLLSPRQAITLRELSRRGPLLRFAEPFQYRLGFAFLRRLLAGEEPFWRPLYLRTLRLAEPDGRARIDELAAEELAMCRALLGGEPERVTAVASRRDAAGDVCALFLTLQYGRGPLAQCTVSLAEASNARKLIAVTSGRTVILDDLDPVAPLRIVASGEQEPSLGEPAATVRRGCHPGRLRKRGRDPIVEEAQRFLDAVWSGDRSLANGDQWVRVAMLWWATRRSVSVGAPVGVPDGACGLGDTEPPPLTVIQGGGNDASWAGQRPALTLVGS